LWLLTLVVLNLFFYCYHRAHHGSKPEYIDKNYANLLIIWDRLFGTFAEETAPVRYGLINNINTFNPLRIAFAEWLKLFRDSAGSNSLQTVGRLWSKPPGWDPLAIAKPTWRRRWPPAPARERGDVVVI
jgi:hypothetical protein